MIAAFESAHPNVSVQLDTRPGGSEGDNLVKTRLATGDMADVFEYNSGSLFQAIAPEANLQPITDQPFVADLDPSFVDVVSAGGEVYGSPWGTFVGGGVLYNIPIYEELGLEIPTTWDEFMANNAAIAEAGDRRSCGADVRGHMDISALRARRLPQCSGREPHVRGRLHEQPGQVRHHAGCAARVRAPAGGPRRRPAERGLCVGDVRRRCDGGRDGSGRALPDAHVRRRETWHSPRRTTSTTWASSPCRARTRQRSA